MRAVIYARYSSSSQTEQSIEGQLRDCYAFAERQNLQVVGEYIDRALTGRSDDRPDFQRMIADSTKKQFDFVIVYKLDRFARNRYDSAIYRHKLKLNGVKVLSAMENIGDNPESIILEAVLEASAEYYSRDLSQKVRRGMRENALKGVSTGGQTPLGYKIIDKKVEVDPEQADLVRMVFEQYAAGVSKKEIVKMANEKGFTNIKGKTVSPVTFRKVLSNPKYIGEGTYNGMPVDTWPAIIDKKLFDKVQNRLEQTRRAPAAKKAAIEYYLRGKAYCGYCGAPLVGESGRGRSGSIYQYYACSNRKKLHTCHKKNEKKDFLEWYVVEQTLIYVLHPDRMDMIAENVVAAYDKEFNSGRVKDLERRLAQIDREITRCVDQLISTDNKLIHQRVKEKADQLELQHNDLSIDLAKLKMAQGIRYTKEDIIAWMKKFCKGDLMDLEFRRRIIDTFINAIYLYDDKLVMYYNVKDGKQISYIDMLETTDESSDSADLLDSNGVRISSTMGHHD